MNFPNYFLFNFGRWTFFSLSLPPSLSLSGSSGCRSLHFSYSIFMVESCSTERIDSIVYLFLLKFSSERWRWAPMYHVINQRGNSMFICEWAVSEKKSNQIEIKSCWARIERNDRRKWWNTSPAVRTHTLVASTCLANEYHISQSDMKMREYFLEHLKSWRKSGLQPFNGIRCECKLKFVRNKFSFYARNESESFGCESIRALHRQRTTFSSIIFFGSPKWNPFHLHSRLGCSGGTCAFLYPHKT